VSVEEKHLLDPLVSLFDISRPVDWKEVFNRDVPLDVEIGFGIGEFLARRTTDFPERNIVGIEQIWERTYKALKKIKDLSPYRFIKILHIDAWVAFERLFDLKTIDKIFCLYPCPWPKKGHIKHRLFSHDFLKLLNSRLKNGGEITLVTDFYPFFEWVLNESLETGFTVKTKKISPQYDTKFERKWIGGGQEQFFEIYFKKVEHQNVNSKRDEDLRVYKIKNFDSKTFQFSDYKEDIAVIFKDMLFDDEQERAMIHLIVSEEHLVQHFWVSVKKEKDHWIIAKAEGQNFFPTTGVAKAIELVFESAQHSCE